MSDQKLRDKSFYGKPM